MKFFIRLALFALFILLVSLADDAEACTCFGPRPPCEAFGSASAVFIGVVKSASTVSTEVDAGDRKFTYGQRLFRFSIEESFKGISDSEVEIITGSGGGDCGYDFRTGQRYLVYAYRGSKDERLGTGICSRTRPFSKAEEDMTFLRTLSKAKPGGRIYGKVIRYSGDMEHGPSAEVGPMARIKLIIKGQGQQFEVITDSYGRYEITGVPPGSYDIHTDLPERFGSILPHSMPDDFGSYSGGKVEVGDKGCAEGNISVWLDGRISGIVRDSEGRPIPKLAIDLVKAETVGGDFRSLKGFWAYSDEEGRYEFRRVQPGRYVIGVNLTTPPNAERPYLRFCYPGVSDPSQATIITIGEGTRITGIDLGLPPASAPQEIRGFVFWSDGRPAAGARVSLDLEDYPERLKMSHSVETDKEGKFTIIGLSGLKYSVQASFYEDRPRFKSYNSVPIDIISNENMPPIKLIISKPLPDADDKLMQKKKP